MNHMLNVTVGEAKWIQQIPFAVFAYRFFFSDNKQVQSEQISSPFRLPRRLRWVAYALEIFLIRQTFFKGKHYFVKFKGNVVGIFTIIEKSEALYILWLAIGREYRRRGIGIYILRYAESLAREMKKTWLEIGVRKRNIKARRLYRKFGFVKKPEHKHKTQVGLRKRVSD